jgi:allophanate hydrolase
MCPGGSSSGSAYVVATGQVDFALGTDTAGSGRVPAGLNNIVGSEALARAHQRCRCGAGRPVGGLRVHLRPTVARRPRAGARPWATTLPIRTPGPAHGQTPFPSDSASACPTRWSSLATNWPSAAFEQAVEQLVRMGGEAVPIDYSPLAPRPTCCMAARWWPSATRPFAVFRRAPGSGDRACAGHHRFGPSLQRRRPVHAQTRLAALAQQAAVMWQGIDLLVVPTAPTHYTMEAMLADPVALNRNLGAYTNFVNLLDYAALSVPSSLRPTDCRLASP